MGEPISLLENALRAWEDLFLIYESRLRIGIDIGIRSREEFVGPVRHWRELRNHLLLLKGNDFDVERFCHNERGVGLLASPFAQQFLGSSESAVRKDAALMDQAYRSLPLQLASWTISSRRSFNLSADIMSRFMSADYSSFKWSDLLWPFDSFLIQFESPYSWRNEHGEEYELLGALISSVYGVCQDHELASKEGFECLPFFRSKNGSPVADFFLDEKERERIEKDLRQKRWKKLNDRIRSSFFKKFTGGADPFEKFSAFCEGDPEVMKEAERDVTMPPGYGEPIRWSKTDSVVSQGKDGVMNRIIAGLCLYLEALPSKVLEDYRWQQSPVIEAKREVRKIITDGEQICRVEDFHVLSPDTMSLFPEMLREGPAQTVTPHWRRAHMRRPKGSPPDAPKTITVRQAKIHADQMPEGSVVGGAVSHVR